ncbi:MAG: carboxypeptidase regulatory-like domain-containing protein [Acidobacteriota bacterium]|nr:carboxypeptidase regulatory-like domain-containing protein [Acidobacteriota bacterium]
MFFGLILLFICGVLPVLAQFETSAVLGFVRDSCGAPIAGSKVKLTNIATGVPASVITDSQGHYQFPDVHVGRYQVCASAAGFSDSVTDPFAVDVNTRQRVDLSLKPGNVSETITVSGAATKYDPNAYMLLEIDSDSGAYRFLNENLEEWSTHYSRPYHAS